MDVIYELKEANVSMVGDLCDLLSKARELGANTDSLSSAVSSFEHWMREDPAITL